MSNTHQNLLSSKVGVVALVPDQWKPCWESRHQVLSRLAGYFPVVWVNHPHGWRDCFSALQQRLASSTVYPTTTEALQIYQPEPWLPLLGRPAWLARLTSQQRLKRAIDLLRARGCTRFVLYIWRPEFASAVREIQHDLSIYHVDDEYSFSPTEIEVSLAERRLFESVGQVFIHSPALIRKKGEFNPNTEFVPNGVDYKLYATAVPEPEDLRNIPRPRIGYVGTLKRMLNWPLLLELSASHPQWSFVFVGPKGPHREIEGMLELMSRRPNVHFLGGKPTDCLGGYPQHFDVCTMPYQVDDYTKYIYPLKMHEYLASGKPVVSAPIRSVEEFRDVIALAKTSEDWSRALENALSSEENAPNRCAQRQRVAREHDWELLVDRIARTIARRLGLEIQTMEIQATSRLAASLDV
jgi:glycosyltransferase involved in cell wall biosynthesis